MYLVNLQFFDRNGLYMGEGAVYAPGKNNRALKDLIKSVNIKEFCGLNPADVHASPETGSPVLVRMEGAHDESQSVCGRVL